jgi:hypothetical protein
MTMRSMPMADPKAVAAAQKEAERLKKEEIAREKEELRKMITDIDADGTGHIEVRQPPPDVIRPESLTSAAGS